MHLYVDITSGSDLVRLEDLQGILLNKDNNLHNPLAKVMSRGRVKGGEGGKGFGKSKTPQEKPRQRNHKHKVALMVS